MKRPSKRREDYTLKHVQHTARPVTKHEGHTDGVPSHVYSNKYTYKTIATLHCHLAYREEKTAMPGKDFHRWYYVGYCDVAYVECYAEGTRMGTKDGSRYCVHMAHRRKFNNTGDWFDIEAKMVNFIVLQLEAKL